jgi:hypothetical protein
VVRMHRTEWRRVRTAKINPTLAKGVGHQAAKP